MSTAGIGLLAFGQQEGHYPSAGPSNVKIT